MAKKPINDKILNLTQEELAGDLSDLQKTRNLLNKRRFDERAISIDTQLDEAIKHIDWDRRNKAKRSLKDFIKTYCIGLMLDDLPSESAEQVLDAMDYALKEYRPQQLMLPRGSGKTTFAECSAIYQLAYGFRKFFVIVSNNSRAAGNILKDIQRFFIEKDTDFANDFPEICKPFELCNGFFRRRQKYRGIDTSLQMNALNVVFPRIVDDNGNELPNSGSIITCRGMGSGIRGLKVGKLRPDSVCLDDLQDAEIASNPEQVEKVYQLINKDILNLSSKGKLAVIMTATPLESDDLTTKFANDINWKTTKFKALIQFPTDMVKHPDKGLWSQYFKLFDSENVADEPHTQSLEFYRSHKTDMDEGAKLFQPDKFKESDGHISGLQALLEKRHLIGDAAFEAEHQMTPTKIESAIDITPNIVVKKANSDIQHLVSPDGYTFTACALDINSSYALTYSIVAFKPDTSSVVLHHDIIKCRIDSKLPDTAYNQAVYSNLEKALEQIKLLGVRIDGMAIDAGGRNWDAVCQFSKQALRQHGIPCSAFAGRSASLFNPFVRSRLRNTIGKTVLCGDAQEHVKSGSGNKYVFFDADFYKEAVQRAMLQPIGSVGGCDLYQGDTKEHTTFALQVCNEKLMSITHHKDGRDSYVWKSKEPHDYLDTMSMCYAVAASQGITGMNFKRQSAVHRVKATPKKRFIIK